MNGYLFSQKKTQILAVSPKVIIPVPLPFFPIPGTYRFTSRLAILEERLENRFTLLEERFERRLSEEIGKVNQRLTEEVSRLDQKISAVQANIIKWMFIFWVGQVGMITAILFAFFRVR